MALPTPPFLSRAPLRVRIALIAVLAIIVTGAVVAVFTLFSTDQQPADAATSADPPPVSETAADSVNAPRADEIDELYFHIRQNRDAINRLTHTFSQNTQQLTILNEQVNAVLRNQQNLNPDNINQRANILDQSLRDINLALEQTRADIAQIVPIQNSIKQLESQLAAATGEHQRQNDQINQTITSLRSDITSLRAELDPISQRIDDLEIRLDNLPTIPAETQTIAARLAECRFSQIGWPPDQRLNRSETVDRFRSIYQNKLQAGTTTNEEMERQLQECERSLW